jgi:hypothetical protein
MGTPAVRKSVRTVVFLPPEVAEWLEKKAAAVFKTPGRFQSDHWVALYNKEKAVNDG